MEAFRCAQLRADELRKPLLNAFDRSIDGTRAREGSESGNKHSIFGPKNCNRSTPLRGITFAKHGVKMLLQKKIGFIGYFHDVFRPLSSAMQEGLSHPDYGQSG
jgi:hypothetical protein